MSELPKQPNLRVSHFAVGIVSPDRLHEVVNIRWGAERKVEVCVSPTGRSVRVFLDGERMEVTDDE